MILNKLETQNTNALNVFTYHRVSGNNIKLMLNITIPSDTASGLTFSSFEQYSLPAPLSGVDAEVNNNVILKFEDEEEAISYAEQLETLSNELEYKSSPANDAIGDIILAIRSDEFVQAYLL